jgi:hypothetical protein
MLTLFKRWKRDSSPGALLGVRIALLLLPLPLLATQCAPEVSGQAPPSAELTPVEAPPPPPPAAPPSDPAPSADVPAAAMTAAATVAAKPADPPPCPAEMALVGQTCVDRYEAHLVAEVGGELSPHPHWQRLEAGVRYLARSAPDVFPQGYISGVEAKAACEASGKRLCSRREWLRACKNKGIETYPYGALGRRGQCNTGKIHLLVEVFGHNPRGGFKYDDHFNSPKLNQTPGFLARTGEHEGCSGDLGVFDMVGNLHEWVSDKVDQGFMDKLDEEDVDRREQPWSAGNGVFMGGFYSTTSELGPGCYYTTVAHEPRYHDYSTGFRCCAAAVLPATLPASTKNKKKKGSG